VKNQMKSRIVLFIILAILLNGPVASSAEQRTPPFALTLPGLEWALEIGAPGFLSGRTSLDPRGDSVYLFASNKETHMLLSVFLEKAARRGSSKECRDFYWNGTKNTPLKKEQIKMYDLGEMAIVEYVVPTFRSWETNQKNLFAYLTRGVYWSYIHLSKMKFVPGEEGLFKQILGSAKFNDSYNPTVLDLYEFGNLSFYRRDFPEAISYYRRALELDKYRKNLGREPWLTLVDHLGMAYAFSGDFTKAKQTYEWAISQESEYPMFFYNLACACAEMNKMDEALSNLRLAFKCKGNLLPDQEFPNPRSDSSFKKYLNDKVFLAELQKME